MLTRIGVALDEAISRRVFDIIVQLPLAGRPGLEGAQPPGDFDQIRSFLSSPGPTAFFDLPWLPLYLVIWFLFHPLIGIAAVVGSLILISLALVTELRTREPMASAGVQAVRRAGGAEVGRRNAEVLRAMGMASRLRELWVRTNRSYLDSQRRAADVSSGLGSASRIFRLTLQSGVLAVGAVLVVEQAASGGIMIASSILVARALAPVEQAISYWKHFVAARMIWQCLTVPCCPSC